VDSDFVSTLCSTFVITMTDWNVSTSEVIEFVKQTINSQDFELEDPKKVEADVLKFVNKNEMRRNSVPTDQVVQRRSVNFGTFKGRPVSTSYSKATVPSGILEVHLIAGRKLAPKDSNGLSDPYARIYFCDKDGKIVDHIKKKSTTVKKTLNPKWNEIYDLEVDLNVGGLYIQIWDWDRIGSDDFMGQFSIPADRFHSNTEMWYPLLPRDAKDEVSGDICIKLRIK